MEPLQFAIVRAAKVKSRSALAAMSAHHARSRQTPNADPDRPIAWAVRSGDPAADVEARIASAGVKARKNGVVAVEVVLTASPAFFRPDDPAAIGTWQDDRLEAWAPRAISWAWDFFGQDNLVSAVFHLDEATPHIHTVVVPVDDSPRQRGSRVRLNAGRWLDGRQKLTALQDRYSNAMKGIGLERDIQGRRANHIAVSKMYGRLARDQAAAAEDRHRAGDMAAVISAFADGQWGVEGPSTVTRSAGPGSLIPTKRAKRARVTRVVGG